MEQQPSELKVCPLCGDVLQVLRFLDITPDGYVCDRCKLWFNDDLEPRAAVIG